MIQQKLTKNKTKMILLTKTLVIFPLTVGRRNRMDKSLNYMRAWLKVNRDSPVDMSI